MTTGATEPPATPDSLDSHVDDETVDSDSSREVPSIDRYTIGFFGADYPVDALYKRLTSDGDGPEGDIFIPDFQRGYVWTKPQADRFIESLLLGLPVPGIFLSNDPETNKRLVIDGSQRLRTIKFFMDTRTAAGKTYLLGKGVHEDFAGRGYHTLTPEDKRRFDDTIIHATIVRQDKPEGDRRSLFHLFERLNTGGTAAQPHEVRRSLWGGTFNDLLKSLDENEHWRHVYGPPSKRVKDQELILRFFALHQEGASYGDPEGTMSGYLTSFMARHRNLSEKQAQELRVTFEEVIELVDDVLGTAAFKPEKRLNAAVFDAVMVGLATARENHGLPSHDNFLTMYKNLTANPAFISATTTGTSQQLNVKSRLSLARKAFSER